MLVWTFGRGKGEAAHKVRWSCYVTPFVSIIYIVVHHSITVVKRKMNIYILLSLRESEKS